LFSTAAFLILTYDKQVECSHGSVMSHDNMTVRRFLNGLKKTDRVV
jgi:hypothetical protein